MGDPVYYVVSSLNSVLSGANNDTVNSRLSKRSSSSNYLNFAGKTYYFGTVFRSNFYRAIQYCRQQGMQLVSIPTQAINDRLGKYIGEIGVGNGHFWTSGTNLADVNQWIWLSTGENFVYTNWHPGEPSYKNSDNVTENCVEARHFGKGFTWNDLNCFWEAYFICESTSSC
ncbi:hypothetical protein NQ318_012963 [Aromia moschata]|uniref:C-type lectin domain-containing protein n=1 Tax=Aromia moschata TaxID=1265417 RepID=A0AAV8XP41_9CUCU|nr:hypothetical protein NQ318_012963 [Aromia moschata]